MNFEGSDEQNTFFFSVICRKARKDPNTLFGHKKGSKLNRNIIFEIFGGDLHYNSGNIFHIKTILKDLMSKIHFSLVLHAEKLEKIKIHFLVTKTGQNRKEILFLKSLEVIYIIILVIFFASN